MLNRHLSSPNPKETVMNVITAVCAGCLTRVDAAELENADRKCDYCRALKARHGLDDDGQPLGADAGVYLDLREFDGGDGLIHCDEV